MHLAQMKYPISCAKILCRSNIWVPLTYVSNESYKFRSFSDKIKIIIIIKNYPFTHKKRPTQKEVSNKRPIVLSSVFAKIPEAVIDEQ
jgi:hypothetical protein